jgi:hypothetical protein
LTKRGHYTDPAEIVPLLSDEIFREVWGAFASLWREHNREKTALLEQMAQLAHLLHKEEGAALMLAGANEALKSENAALRSENSRFQCKFKRVDDLLNDQKRKIEQLSREIGELNEEIRRLKLGSRGEIASLRGEGSSETLATTTSAATSSPKATTVVEIFASHRIDAVATPLPCTPAESTASSGPATTSWFFPKRPRALGPSGMPPSSGKLPPS